MSVVSRCKKRSQFYQTRCPRCPPQHLPILRKKSLPWRAMGPIAAGRPRPPHPRTATPEEEPGTETKTEIESERGRETETGTETKPETKTRGRRSTRGGRDRGRDQSQSPSRSQPADTHFLLPTGELEGPGKTTESVWHIFLNPVASLLLIFSFLFTCPFYIVLALLP